MDNQNMEAEKKLLTAIFNDNEDGDMPDNYPDTDAEKIGYAAYALTKTLEHISPALQRLYRMEALCKLGAPPIIAYNEARIALKHLRKVKLDVDAAYNETLTVYKRSAAYKREDGSWGDKNERT